MAQTITMEILHEDMKKLRQDIGFIKHALAEDFELSESAKKELEEARKEPLSTYISHDDVLEEFLGQ